MEEYNIAICGVPGIGKSRKCKQDISELLLNQENAIYIYDKYGEYTELNNEESESNLNVFSETEKYSIPSFLDLVYDAALYKSFSKKFKVFIEGISEEKIDALELIKKIIKLNSINIQVIIVVQVFLNILCDNDAADIYLPRFRENFSEYIVE